MKRVPKMISLAYLKNLVREQEKKDEQIKLKRNLCTYSNKSKNTES